MRRTVLYQRHGGGDPTMAVAGEVIWRASRTPEGIATLAIRETSPGVIRGAAWGPGAGWALAQLPALCGALDEPGDFDPTHHPLIAAAHHRNPGVRIGRTDVFFDSLASAIIEQKVTGMQAFAAWRRLVTWHGERAPGPTPRPLYAPPSIDGWRMVPSWSWHRAGLEPPQARTVVEAARRGEAIGRVFMSATDGEARDRVLISQRGIGPWTSAETRIRALGDADAVSVGDFHLAHEVGLRPHRNTRRRRRDAGAPRPVGGTASARHPADRSERRPRAAPRAATAPRGSPRPLNPCAAGMRHGMMGA